jgi:CRP/FNR family cyclic AMP-dependent transcriptional regulator
MASTERARVGGEKGIVVASRKRQRLSRRSLLPLVSGATTLECGTNRNIFSQGEPADSVFYLRQGKVKLMVTSPEGKEAIVAFLRPGDFFGEGCLAGQPLRMATAVTMDDCSLTRIAKPMMAQLLHEQDGFAQSFLGHLLSRNIRYEADLVDQLFNSSERRLARILLLLAHFDKESRSGTVVPGVSQEHLAQMVGTTRSRVCYFMNKFRKLGFVEYNGRALTVNSGLTDVVSHESLLFDPPHF